MWSRFQCSMSRRDFHFFNSNLRLYSPIPFENFLQPQNSGRWTENLSTNCFIPPLPLKVSFDLLCVRSILYRFVLLMVNFSDFEIQSRINSMAGIQMDIFTNRLMDQLNCEITIFSMPKIEYSLNVPNDTIFIVPSTKKCEIFFLLSKRLLNQNDDVILDLNGIFHLDEHWHWAKMVNKHHSKFVKPDQCLYYSLEFFLYCESLNCSMH